VNDFMPPPAPTVSSDSLFTSPAQVMVQSPSQSHETKKDSGSSDGAMTYDTIRS